MHTNGEIRQTKKIMTKVFNTEEVDWTKQPMFFGAEPNTQRFDQQKYPVFEKLNQQQLGFFWRPEEVSLQKDRNDFNSLTVEQKHIFTANLKYQTLLDSVQGRGPCLAFLPYCSLPELESMLVAWDFSETIHSRSYTYIMKNVYSDPTEVLDTIIDTPEIMDRAKTVTEAYDKFITYAHQYHLNGKGTMREMKKLLYLTLINVNILEGIRFYVSFACSFTFGELKLMEGSAKIISLIARDESQHLVITQNILKNWANGDDPDMLEIMKEEESNVYKMFSTCVEEEKNWAEYLFKDGSMIGLNDKLLQQYVEWIANRRMKAIGIKPEYDIPAKNNPLPWTEHWISSKGLQVAPQETEVESYVVGGIKQDVKADTFSQFKL